MPPIDIGAAATDLPRLCGLRSMETHWILTHVSGRPLFSAFCVKIYQGDTLMLNKVFPVSVYLDGSVTKLMGMMCFSKIFSDGLSFCFGSRTDVVFFIRLATSCCNQQRQVSSGKSSSGGVSTRSEGSR